MKQFHIFVEGDADIKFLYDYIEEIFSISLNAKINRKGGIEPKTLHCIQATNGWTVFKSDAGATFRDKMKENTSNGIINLVVFDADTSKNGGGFADRKQEIDEWKAKYELNFELFLFPNNQDDGELENLLENIINPQNAPVFDCWQKFEDCLPTKTTCTKNPLTIPAKKSKIYAYMEVLLGESNSEKDKAKDPNRDFKKTEHWDLTAKAIEPLKDFLHSHIA